MVATLTGPHARVVEMCRAARPPARRLTARHARTRSPRQDETRSAPDLRRLALRTLLCLLGGRALPASMLPPTRAAAAGAGAQPSPLARVAGAVAAAMCKPDTAVRVW